VTADRPPHILSITCHDLGRHLGCYGVETVRSPHLDRLAAEGARFERAFCSAPQCSPSRASLATGRHPHSNGVMGLTHGGFTWDLAPTERPVASLLAEQGYSTHLFGLQHVSPTLERLGFDHTHAVGGSDGGATHAASGEVVAGAFEDILPEAVREATGPLYLEANFFEPHRPYDYGGVRPDRSGGVQVPPYLPPIPEATEEMAALQGAIRKVDGEIGRILDTLDALGIANQTLVVFSADHGLAMPRAKCTLYDPGIGIALLVRWPDGGVRPDAVVPGLVGNVDVLPALLEAAGAPVPTPVQGTSLLPAARGTSTDGRQAVFAEKTYHSYYDPMRCVRTDRHKLIRNFDSAFAVEVPGDVQQGAIFRADPGRYVADRRSAVELYDLERDPLEQHNLAGQSDLAALQRDLDARLWSWMEDTQDPLLRGPVPSPAYSLAMSQQRRV
jgi:N-sulfoglucosamine sulfohydrolase